MIKYNEFQTKQTLFVDLEGDEDTDRLDTRQTVHDIILVSSFWGKINKSSFEAESKRTTQNCVIQTMRTVTAK